jgi:hypothetical protein
MPTNRLTAEQLAAIKARAEAHWRSAWTGNADGTIVEQYISRNDDIPALLAHIEELERERGRLRDALEILAADTTWESGPLIEPGITPIPIRVRDISRAALAESPPAPLEGETA